MEVLKHGVLLTEHIEGDGEDGADQKAVQQAVVHGSNTEHSGGTEGTPENTGGEEGVDSPVKLGHISGSS